MKKFLILLGAIMALSRFLDNCCVKIVIDNRTYKEEI